MDLTDLLAQASVIHRKLETLNELRDKLMEADSEAVHLEEKNVVVPLSEWGEIMAIVEDI